MGYKYCTSGVQIFLGYKLSKWGTVPPNGVQMAALEGNYFHANSHNLSKNAVAWSDLRALILLGGWPAGSRYNSPCRARIVVYYPVFPGDFFEISDPELGSPLTCVDAWIWL
ncbi:unnamed protein product [Adineta ricciae]|uniref:Uncharacterized protein n=1 Tax=Adineta ricciae TaxID=249248 RepID=A0A814VQR7_ADIRI|nr:unnamed protein product [Adineta ricciae]CAF1523281.1 unnamed protein product [Adineta ricciae]